MNSIVYYFYYFAFIKNSNRQFLCVTYSHVFAAIYSIRSIYLVVMKILALMDQKYVQMGRMYFTILFL